MTPRDLGSRRVTEGNPAGLGGLSCDGKSRLTSMSLYFPVHTPSSCLALPKVQSRGHPSLLSTFIAPLSVQGSIEALDQYPQSCEVGSVP